MKVDKNIDRLFQEKLKDFEVTPSPQVWKNIEQELTQKKKRRVLPFWLFSGVAACIVIGLFLFPFKKEQNLIIPNNENNELNVVETDKPIEKPKVTEEQLIKETPLTEVATSEENNEKNVTKKTIIQKQDEAIATTFSNVDNKATESIKNNEKEVVSKIAMNKKPFKKQTDNTIKNDQKTKGVSTKIAVNKKSTNQQTKEETNKKNEEKKKLTKKQLNENEINEKKDKKINRWALQPTFGILTANSYSKGSPIDSKFNENKVVGKNTQSYGLKVAYKINEKWSVQSGVHLQEVEFSIKDVVVSSGAISMSNSANITNIEQKELAFNSPTSKGNYSTNSIRLGDVFNTNNGVLNQKYGYIELPIEVKYAFLNKQKISISTVAGFSSLLLTKNQIEAENGKNSKVFAEATNLSPVNFSINAGLDFNYSLNKKLNFTISPMVKSPLNTFSKGSNGFKPYYIGIYTGIRYRF